MGISELSYVVAGGAAALALAFGTLTVSIEPHEFRLARICFRIAAFALGSIPVVWNLTAPQNIYVRFLVVGLSTAVVAVLLAEGLRFVTRREGWVEENKTAASKPAAAFSGPRLQGASSGPSAASAPKPEVVVRDRARPRPRAISNAPAPIGASSVLGRYVSSPSTPAAPLRRLIAYELPKIDLNGKITGDTTQWYFQVATLRVQNVSDDTITIKATRMVVYYNDVGQSIISTRGGQEAIVAQTQGEIFQARAEDKTIYFPLTIAKVIVDFEVQYDTIPKTGIRISSRRVLYNVNWANGHNSFPLFEPTILEQSEK